MIRNILLSLFTISFSCTAMANLLDFSNDYSYLLTPIEKDAAIAQQNIYDNLLALGCPNSLVEETTAPAVCSEGTFNYAVWEEVRELIHTANSFCSPPAICGPTDFSFQISPEALVKVLRWQSAEEYSTQEDMANNFLSEQLGNLKSRITAIHAGTRGFQLSGFNPTNNESLVDYSGNDSGRSSGDNIPAWSPWGGFINFSYSEGTQDPTERENAYDSRDDSVNAGIDYRLNDAWVIGATLANHHNQIDFDAQKSTTDGTIKMTGISVIPFVLYQSPEWFFSTSTGYQTARFKNSRGIHYKSFNPSIDDVNTAEDSKNNADIYSLSLASGYAWHIPSYPALSIEPSLSTNYQKTLISQFSEKDMRFNGLNLQIKEQNIESLESILALRVMHVFSSQGIVLAPFVETAQHTQYKNDPNIIEASYVNATYDIGTATQFRFETNPADRAYFIYTIGSTFVLKGARQATPDKLASGGLQGFVSYSSIKHITGFAQQTLAGGLRYEF